MIEKHLIINLSRIVNGYDKYVTLESTDSICFADPSYEAQELTSVRIKMILQCMELKYMMYQNLKV